MLFGGEGRTHWWTALIQAILRLVFLAPLAAAIMKLEQALDVLVHFALLTVVQHAADRRVRQMLKIVGLDPEMLDLLAVDVVDDELVPLRLEDDVVVDLNQLSEVCIHVVQLVELREDVAAVLDGLLDFENLELRVRPLPMLPVLHDAIVDVPNLKYQLELHFAVFVDLQDLLLQGSR